MVTYDLMQRGLSFDEAYAMARSVRDRLRDRDEISTAELKDILAREVEAQFGSTPWLVGRRRPAPALEVVDPAGVGHPFSRGLLANSIQAAGVDLDRAYRLVAQLQTDLRSEGIGSLRSEDLAQRVGDLLERFEDSETAARYRIVRGVQHLPRPLVIYIGGASGTGKSTLSLELAPLLKIYRVNATDTIRQVMRMVFAPSILPAIHRSSFERSESSDGLDVEEGTQTLSESDRELTAGFVEQATHVCVGVRAVVERALAENMHVLVEGVHLLPPLVPFADLEATAYQLALILCTLDEETHRKRFLVRGRHGQRDSERYLSSFADIRRIQEFILQRAETHDVPMLDTTDRDRSTPQVLRLFTSVLRKKVPTLTESPSSPEARRPASLLLAVDGLPDRPIRALGGRTPLGAALTPVFDRLAQEGISGLADPVAPGEVPDTASGSLALFGQSPRAMRRGPVEALGAGFELGPGEIAVRGNLATLDEAGQVIDRRAGRIREGGADLASALDGMVVEDPGGAVTVFVRRTTEHRLAIVLRGDELSPAVRGSDPGEGAGAGPPLAPVALDQGDPAAERTARALQVFEARAREILAAHPVNRERAERSQPTANAVLTRGAGRIHLLLPLERDGRRLSIGCVCGDGTIRGLARWLGAEVISGPEMTANLDTRLDAKFGAAQELLRRHDLVVVHVKGADIAAHDGRPDLKKSFIEQLDHHLGELLNGFGGPLRVAIASDHATFSDAGQHGSDPVPTLLWGDGIASDSVVRFDESSAAGGGLKRFPLQILIRKLLDLP